MLHMTLEIPSTLSCSNSTTSPIANHPPLALPLASLLHTLILVYTVDGLLIGTGRPLIRQSMKAKLCSANCTLPAPAG
ncbi:hypothetical protein IWZ01DRAFT_551209 [Phyllosticta capitalensis]